MISLNVTYYNEAHYLKWWYKTVRRLEDEGYDFILNVGDDGSMKDPAAEFFKRHKPTKNMRLFRVTNDIGFNSHGTRNLLMRTTTTDWNLLSDVDRQYSDDTLKRLCVGEEDLSQRYYYSFTHDKTQESSLNDYVVHRTDFWKTGGYDEEFVNVHWGDRMFLKTLTKVARKKQMEMWKVKYVRGARNVTYDDIPFTLYPDDKTLIHPLGWWSDEARRHEVKNMVGKRNETAKGRQSKQVLNFEWTQIF